MSRISTAFFSAAVLYGLAGMSLGIFMGATQDFALRPVHAHLNLLGWAGLAIMGGFYGLAGDRAPAKLAWLVFVLANLGNVLSMSMVYLISQGKPPIVPVLMVGELSLVASMALFGVSVLMAGRKPALA
jgi:hypothetical protein